MSIRIEHPGTHTLLIDGGRPHRRHQGVPLGGPADRAAWQIANALLNNPPDTPALELTLSGPTVTTTRPASFALFGASFRMERDGEWIEPGRVFTLLPAQRLRITSATRGVRAYLAVAGGITSPRLAGAVAVSNAIQAGQILEAPSIAAPLRSLGFCSLQTRDESPLTIRVVPGPQADWFPADVLDREFRVSTQSNRMGIRLEGAPTARPTREMTSEPVAPGAIQITNEGLPIILGVDGQTIGGYPKPAHVIAADLDLLAQLRPGSALKFARVDDHTAAESRRQRQQTLQRWLMRLAVHAGLPARFS